MQCTCGWTVKEHKTMQHPFFFTPIIHSISFFLSGFSYLHATSIPINIDLYPSKQTKNKYKNPYLYNMMYDGNIVVMHIGIYTWPTTLPTRNMIGHKGLFGASMYFPFVHLQRLPTRPQPHGQASIYRGSTTPGLPATLPWLMSSPPPQSTTSSFKTTDLVHILLAEEPISYCPYSIHTSHKAAAH